MLVDRQRPHGRPHQVEDDVLGLSVLVGEVEAVGGAEVGAALLEQGDELGA